MKNKILGWIGIVWGGLIVVGGGFRLLSGEFAGGSYGAGQLFALLLGVFLLYAGIRALRSERSRSAK